MKLLVSTRHSGEGRNPGGNPDAQHQICDPSDRVYVLDSSLRWNDEVVYHQLEIMVNRV